jgi:nonsense-mediated mRNA decay protein 3
MARSGAFCPRCGAAVDADERPGSAAATPGAAAPGPGLCADCYFQSFEFVDAPDRVEVSVCARCGAVRRESRWEDVGAADYTDVAVQAVTEALGVHVDASDVSWEVAPEQVDETTIRMHCHFSGEVDGHPVGEEVTVPVKIGRGTCTRCGRIAGGSYASVVQVRAPDRTPTTAETDRAAEIAHEVVAEMAATGDREAFVTEVTEVADGLDLKVSTTKIGMKVARRIVDELGGSAADSETLVTEDADGNEVYRVTYAVSLPAYRPGEVIDPEDGEGPVLVRSVRGNLKGVRLASGDRYEAPFQDGEPPRATRLGSREGAAATTLVAVEDDNAVQVLDPETSEAITVPRPDYLDPDADEVPVLKSRAGVYVLPDEAVPERD